MGYFVFVKTTKKYRTKKVLAMLVVAVAENSQRNRFMLESFARQRYDRDKLKTDSLSSILSRVDDGQSHGTIRLPFVILEKVANYARALNEVIKIRFERELKIARWFAYHRLLVCGATLSTGRMNVTLIGYHLTITVDGKITGWPTYDKGFCLTVGTYLRIVRSDYCKEWRVEKYPFHDIGFLIAGGGNKVPDYDGVVVCVYSELPMVTGDYDRQYDIDYRQYDVVVVGRSHEYHFNEWDELYWPFTQMVKEREQNR